MPVNRSYGYSGYGGTYSSYTPGMYTSSFATTYGNRAGSSSPATLRSTTPSRGFGSNSLINTIMPEDRTTSSPATYKYLATRQDYYSPSAYSRVYSSELEKRDLKTIKTEEIDTSEKKETSRDHAIPGEITRDTTLNIRGGKPVVRMVTQKSKESPYLNNTGWRARMKEEEEPQMTLGQRLAMKHQISEKPKVKEKTPPPAPRKTDNHKCDSGEESEWTWETCSSSEAEDYTPRKTKKKTPTPPKRKSTPKQTKQISPPPEPPKRAPVAYTKSNTTTLCSTDDKTSIKQTAPPTPNSAIRNKWLDAMYNEPKPKPQTNSIRIPNFGKAVAMNRCLIDNKMTKEPEKPTAPIRSSSTSNNRPISWAGSHAAIQDVQGNIHTDNNYSIDKNKSTETPVNEKKSKPPPSVSSGSSSSPPLYKYNPRKPQKYVGAGSQLFDSSDEDSPTVNAGWRPGQPPRGDVVVKLTGNKSKAVINSEHSKVTNKVLTSDTEIKSTISSKVPTTMQDKYSIPGLFIKPSTKAAPKSVKPVEAKLTLSPVEGTISLTTKVVEEKNSYQSSIFVPSKSPMLEARMQQRNAIGEKQHSSTPSVKSISTTSPSAKPKQNNEVSTNTSQEPISNINLGSVMEKEAKSEEESEWEYYTETEPSDTEDAKKDAPITLPPADTTIKTSNSMQSNGSKKVETKSLPNSNNIPKVTLTDNKPKVVTPIKNKEPVKPKVIPKKHPIDISVVQPVESKKVSKTNLDVNKNIASVKSIVVPPPPVKIPVKDVPKKSEVLVTQKSTSDNVNVQASELNQKPTEQSQTKAQLSGVKQEKDISDKKATQNISSNLKPGKLNLKDESQNKAKEQMQPKANNEQAPKIAPPTKDVKQVTNDIPIKGNLKPKSPGETTPMSDKLTKKEEKNIPKTSTITQANESKASKTVEKKPQPNAAAVTKTDDIRQKVDKVKPPVQKQSDKPPETTTEKQAEQTVKTCKQTKINESKETKKVEESNVKDISAPHQKENVDLILAPASKKSLDDEQKENKDESRISSPVQNNMPATSLDRLPSALKTMFTKTENVSPKLSPENAPKWFNNVPKEDPNYVNPTKVMSEMKKDVNNQKEKISKDEQTLIKISDQADHPWYNDDDDDMKELLQKRPSILKEIDQAQDRRLTPEENMAVIKMYGGVMFPGGPVEKTPKSWLFKLRKAIRADSIEKKKQRDSGIESQLVSLRNSSSSASSSVSSFTGFSKSPSPEGTDGNSDEYSDSDEEDNKVYKNPVNQAPTKTRPDFRKYGVKDFRFLKVLGKGSFGKVLLAELKNSQNFYAVKALRKDSVLEDDDIECTMIERKVLALGVKHPFLCHLFCTFQTDSHLYFVMEYLNGGDLMFHIQQQGRFDTERARFYSAEIVCALRFLHRKGIVYRDLKLDNLLLDYEGHIRIVDFGMCKLQVYLDKTADTFCGTPDYMAPEIIKGMKYTHSVDWWSFGVLLYEMLIGQSPFNGCDEDELFWSICNEQAYFPRFLSKEAKQILLLLLEKNPANRLGVSESIHGDVRTQPFFKPIDFNKLEKRQVVPPYKPKLKNPMDVSYFDTAFTDEPVKLTPVDKEFLEDLNQIQFKGFSYTNKIYTAK